MRDQNTSMETHLFRLISLTISILCLFLILPANLLQDLSPYMNLGIFFYGLVAAYLYRCSCHGSYFIKSLYGITLLLLNIIWFLNGGTASSISYFFFAAVLYPLIFFQELPDRSCS